jgi:SAM-dependent methyltransferase
VPSVSLGGVREGWRVLDCGCGPIRALPSLAEFVGGRGVVVGLDASAAAVGRARSARSGLASPGAGLEVSSSAGFFTVMEPEVAFELQASSLAAGRARAIDAGVASERQIDDLIQPLRAAKDGDYEWVTSPFFLDLAFRKP